MTDIVGDEIENLRAEDKVYSIGNSAGSGAKMYLISQEQREKAKKGYRVCRII